MARSVGEIDARAARKGESGMAERRAVRVAGDNIAQTRTLEKK